MPQGLTRTDGMMYVEGEGRPWHGLGVAVNGPANAAETIAAASLNWEVETRPVYQYAPSEIIGGNQFYRHLEIPNKNAIVRADTNEVFAVMGSGYEPVQNVDAFSFFDEVIAQGEAIYHTAGSLFGGRKVWILAKLPDDIVVTETDKIGKYILLSNSHDGSSALRMKFTPIRVVCSNTLSVALSDTSGFYAKHTRNVLQRASEAREVLGLAAQYYDIFATQVDRLVNARMTVIEVQDYLQKLYNFKEDVSYDDQDYRVTRAYENTLDLLNHRTNRVGGMEGTKWAAYNAVTYYLDHERTVSGQDGYELDRRLDSTWFGRGVELRQKAFNLLVE